MTRRICAALACLALGLGLLAGCAGQPKTTVSDNAQRFTAYYFDVFDTMTQVIAYCDSQAEFDRQVEALHADLVAYHQLYDIYNDYEGLNNIKTINDNAGVAPVEVDQRIIDMLELAVEMYDTTGGKLNVAMGSVLAVWHDYREAAEADPSDADNRLPTQEELDAAAQHCDISDLIIDREAGTVYLADPEMRLDVGSVGKGYAVEQVCLAAKERGLVSLSLSVGGNLRSVGTKPRGESWESGIVSPWDDSLLYGSSSSLLAAVRHGGRGALPPHHRPRHPLARRLLHRRHHPLPRLGAGRLPVHRHLLYAPRGGHGPHRKPGRRRGPQVHQGRPDHQIQRV